MEGEDEDQGTRSAGGIPTPSREEVPNASEKTETLGENRAPAENDDLLGELKALDLSHVKA